LHRTILSSEGITLTKDGEVSDLRTVITPDGVGAPYIVGLLGEFVQLRANQIVVGDAGEKIADSLLASAANWNGKTTLITGAGIYTGQVVTNQLIAGSAKITTALIEDLVVGGNVQMGPNAVITWGQINGSKPAIDADNTVNVIGVNRLTKITSTGVYTGTVETDQLISGTAKISTALIDNLVVGSNVSIGNAQDAAGVTTIINGTVTTGYVNALGITANTVVAGISISSPNISGGNIVGVNITGTSTIIGATVKTAASGQRVELDSDQSQVDLYNATDLMLRIHALTSSSEIFSPAGKDLYIGSGGALLIPRGSWNFVNALVSGISISGITDLSNQLSTKSSLSYAQGLEARIATLETQMNYLNNTAFTLSYRTSSGITFNSKNVAGVDTVPDVS
jgi:hypothetical protein